MVIEKLVTLVQQIYEKTKSGELKWEETSEEGTFLVAFPNYVVQITMTPETESHYATYILRILNERSIIIEEITSASLSEYYSREFFKELYEEARRKALGTEDAIDSLLESLRVGTQPPPPLTNVPRRGR